MTVSSQLATVGESENLSPVTVGSPMGPGTCDNAPRPKGDEGALRNSAAGTQDSSVPGLVPFLERLREAVFEFDDLGRCHYTNPAFDDLVGLKDRASSERLETHLIGTAMPFWISQTERTRWRFFVELHSRGRGVELGIGPVQFNVIRVDGSPMRCDFTGERLLSRTGVLLGMVAVVRPNETTPLTAGLDFSEITSELHRLTSAVEGLMNRGTASSHRPLGSNVVWGNLSASSLDEFDGRKSGEHGECLQEAPDSAAAAAESASRADAARRVASLSERELAIVRGLLTGKRTATMARELYLSEHTVRNHLKRIYRKICVHSLGELREYLMPLADEILHNDRWR